MMHHQRNTIRVPTQKNIREAAIRQFETFQGISLQLAWMRDLH
jgi:hypothetical protein